MTVAGGVLVLAGTAEATALARALVARGVPVVASLAGRTSDPGPLPCPVRTGGFGGVPGLVATLRDGGHRVLVDATHPFAAVMPHHAAAAATAAGVPRLRLLRPGWSGGSGDDWRRVPHLDAAAELLGASGAARVLLTTGRQELAPFAGCDGVAFVVRSIERPDPLVLPGATVVTGRPPFTVDDEVALLRAHRIDTLVTKDSGAPAAAAKLEAARHLGIRVVVVDRPPPPPGPTVTTVAGALAWVVERAVERVSGGG